MRWIERLIPIINETLEDFLRLLGEALQQRSYQLLYYELLETLLIHRGTVDPVITTLPDFSLPLMTPISRMASKKLMTLAREMFPPLRAWFTPDTRYG